MTYPWEDLENEEYMYRIMIVEDDEVIASAIRQHPGFVGHGGVLCAGFFRCADRICRNRSATGADGHSSSLFNGYHWCQEIRKVSKVPVLFLSSASDNMSIIMAVNMGGDDFIAKPFDLNVLTAKVQALLRRTYEFAGATNLLEHKGKAVSRDTLMMRLWESDSFIDDNTLTVNVTRLRRKLEEIGLSDYIQTKKGVGYLLT